MELAEIFTNIGNVGILIVIAGMYLYYNPKMITVIANNTSAMQDTKIRHDNMDKTLQEIKTDIKELKAATDLSTVYATLEKLEAKIDELRK